MALAVNNVRTGTFGGDTSFAYNAGSGPGRVLLAMIAIDDPNDRLEIITYNGVAMTSGFYVSGSVSVECYYLENPPEGSHTLAIEAPTDTYGYTLMSVSGANTMDAIGNTNTASGNSNTPSVSVTPQEAGSLLIAGVMVDDDGV